MLWQPNKRGTGACLLLLLSAAAPVRAAQPVEESASAAVHSQLDDELKRQRERITALERLVQQQGLMLEKLQERLAAVPHPQTASVPPAATGEQVLGEVASMAPVVPSIAATAPVPVLPKIQKDEAPAPSPLSFQIGSAHITPIGFVDLTSIWRSTNLGSGLGTNFGGIPYENTTQGKLTELRLTAQSSRIGSRVDANVKGARVTAYWESDFNGLVPGNAAVNTNSDSFRLRLYWVDVRKGKWEILGGQSWSMITPGRKGISPLPADLFYTQVIDVNYQAGLTFARDPQMRLVYHPNDVVAAGVSFESAEQYIGGSAGGGLITMPSTLVTPFQSQLNNGGTALSVPNLHPDIVAKIAFDPKLPNGRGLHFEIGGTARTFKVYNPLVNQHFAANGFGGQANLNLELFKGFRAVTNNYWSDGGGRWIFGQAPDLIVRSDGSLSPVHSGSTVSGFEFTRKNTLLYGYYGGIYIGRNTTIDAASGKYAGYGYPGSPGSQNRSIQQGTLGFMHTFWKDARYGALSLMGQYSYLVRNPWAVAFGQPKKAQEDIVYFNLRYALPGSPPAAR